MLKKISLVLVASTALLAAAGYALYATNSATKGVAATIHGIHDFADYRAAIDASLAQPSSD